MDVAAVLDNYLPLSFKSPREQEYIAFLWKSILHRSTHLEKAMHTAFITSLTLTLLILAVSPPVSALDNPLSGEVIGVIDGDNEGINRLGERATRVIRWAKLMVSCNDIN